MTKDEFDIADTATTRPRREASIRVHFPRFSPRFEDYDELEVDGIPRRTVRGFCPQCGKKITERTFILETFDPNKRTDEEQTAVDAMRIAAKEADGETFMKHLLMAHSASFQD